MRRSGAVLLFGCLVVACLLLQACADVPPFCSSTDAVPVDGVCSSLGLTNDAAACQAIPILEQLGLLAQPLRCQIDSCGGVEVPPDVDKHGTLLPQDLPDIRSYHAGVPDTLDYRQFLKHEGATYYWYFRNLLSLNNWAPCPVVNTSVEIGLPLPYGWQGVQVFDLPQPPSPNDTLPFAVLLRPDPSESYKRHHSCKSWYAETAQAAASARQAQAAKAHIMLFGVGQPGNMREIAPQSEVQTVHPGHASSAKPEPSKPATPKDDAQPGHTHPATPKKPAPKDGAQPGHAAPAQPSKPAPKDGAQPGHAHPATPNKPAPKDGAQPGQAHPPQSNKPTSKRTTGAGPDQGPPEFLLWDLDDIHPGHAAPATPNKPTPKDGAQPGHAALAQPSKPAPKDGAQPGHTHPATPNKPAPKDGAQPGHTAPAQPSKPAPKEGAQPGHTHPATPNKPTPKDGAQPGRAAPAKPSKPPTPKDGAQPGHTHPATPNKPAPKDGAHPGHAAPAQPSKPPAPKHSAQPGHTHPATPNKPAPKSGTQPGQAHPPKSNKPAPKSGTQPGQTHPTEPNKPAPKRTTRGGSDRPPPELLFWDMDDAYYGGGSGHDPSRGSERHDDGYVPRQNDGDRVYNPNPSDSTYDPNERHDEVPKYEQPDHDEVPEHEQPGHDFGGYHDGDDDDGPYRHRGPYTADNDLGYRHDDDNDGPEFEHPGPDYEPGADSGYYWEHERYDNEYYSCGDGESEQTSPNLVLLLRGSLSLFEGGLDFAYNQVPAKEYGPGMVQAGYWFAAENLWLGGMRDTIKREIKHGCRTVTLAGYSLGGALAQLLAIRIEALLKEAYDGEEYEKVAAPVTVVSFGASNVGDAEWAAHFNRKINARNIAFQGDLVAQLPCQPSMVGCTVPPASIDTTRIDNNGVWSYQRTGANIRFPASVMPFNEKYDALQNWAVFLEVSGQQLCSEAFFPGVIAGHLCSYLCMTSQFVHESNNMCWLNPTTDPPEGATRCGCFGSNQKGLKSIPQHKQPAAATPAKPVTA